MTVVSIAIISIVAANTLLLSTEVPSNELTLKAFFLLYEANAKHKPKAEYIAQP